MSPAGREGNGGGADADDAASGAGATVMVDVAEVTVGAGVGADKRGAEGATNSDHRRVYVSMGHKTKSLPFHEMTAELQPDQ